jgi:uncharacterized membrane protein YhiD involved in acid resistance
VRPGRGSRTAVLVCMGRAVAPIVAMSLAVSVSSRVSRWNSV